jgi:hypothetical protein
MIFGHALSISQYKGSHIEMISTILIQNMGSLSKGEIGKNDSMSTSL